MDTLLLSLIFFISPFIDSITGLFIKLGILSESSLFSPSQLYRLFIFLLLFLSYLRYFNKGIILYLLIFILILYLSFESIIGILFFYGIKNVFLGYLGVLKVFYLIILGIYLNKLLEKEIINIDVLIKYIIVHAAICLFLVISTTLLKINNSTYNTSTFGTIGLFPSGNGLSLYLGAVSTLSLLYSRNNKNMISVFLVLFLIFGNLLIGTKASLVFFLLNMYYYFKYTPQFFKWLILIIVGTVIAFFHTKIFEIFNVIFEVIIFRYKHSSSLFAFLSSGRDNYVSSALSKLNVGGLFSLRLIFGMGYFISFRTPSSYLPLFDTLENDLFDIFFMYGFIGLLFYFGYFISVLKLGLNNHSQYLLLFIAIFSYSFIAGHCLFNAMSGTLLVYSYLVIKYERKYIEMNYN